MTTTFRYAAYDGNGKRVIGDVEAVSQVEALRQLTRRGLTPFEIKSDDIAKPRQSRSIRANLTRSKDLAHFSSELAALLSAGLAIDDALRIIADQNAASPAGLLAASLLNDLAAGQSLTAAIELRATGVPGWLLSILKAGEARGALGATFADIAKLLDARLELTSKVRAALIYPLILLIIALGTLTLVFTVLFPVLLRLFEDNGTEPPFLLALVRDLRSMSTSTLIATGCGLLISGLAAWLLKRRHRTGPGLLDRLPIIGQIRSKMAVAIATRTLGTLLANGVPLTDALAMTGAASPGRQLGPAFGHARLAVMEGRRLTDALTRTAALPPAALRLVIIGEETGRLDKTLLEAARIYEREVERAVERAMTLLSPAITVLVGLLIGAIVLSVMQAILAVNTLAVR
jgi:general secretion pathway protein F